jgi:hypothetical protein
MEIESNTVAELSYTPHAVDTPVAPAGGEEADEKPLLVVSTPLSLVSDDLVQSQTPDHERSVTRSFVRAMEQHALSRAPSRSSLRPGSRGPSRPGSRAPSRPSSPPLHHDLGPNILVPPSSVVIPELHTPTTVNTVTNG